MNSPKPANNSSQPAVNRSPQRITITISMRTYEKLVSQSNLEGRSMSSLAAYIIESTLDKKDAN